MYEENEIVDQDEDDIEANFDAFDDGYALASAGWGTDEDYGCYGDDY
jgi:hypothetical protein